MNVKHYATFTLIKAGIILIFAWQMLTLPEGWLLNFPMILMAEVVLFGIGLAAIAQAKNNLLGGLQVFVSLAHITVSIIVLIKYYNYREYYINNQVLIYWSIAQAVYIVLFLLCLVRTHRIISIFSILLMLGTIAIVVNRVLDKTLHGDHSHLFQPLTYIGLLYLGVALLTAISRRLAPNMQTE
ncbi:hypothetical protein BKI52_25600 [marine bacterium AO1-C]|nr:hypothetical protein BKI52_25600 [marine bacterium AO1-C]